MDASAPPAESEHAARKRAQRWEARNLTQKLQEFLSDLTHRRLDGNDVYKDEVSDAQGLHAQAMQSFLRAKEPPRYSMPLTQRELTEAREELIELHRYALDRPMPREMCTALLPSSLRIQPKPLPASTPEAGPVSVPAPAPTPEAVTAPGQPPYAKCRWRVLHGPNGRDWPHIQKLRQEQIERDEAFARTLAVGSKRQLRNQTPPPTEPKPEPAPKKKKSPNGKAPVKEKRTICGMYGCILARHHPGLCQCPEPLSRRQRACASVAA